MSIGSYREIIRWKEYYADGRTELGLVWMSHILQIALFE